jgi:hypothetical protein
LIKIQTEGEGEVIIEETLTPHPLTLTLTPLINSEENKRKHIACSLITMIKTHNTD